MLGLFYLAWLALTLVIVDSIVRNLVRVVRVPEERSAASGRLLVLAAVFALVTWPFLLGRPVHHLKCQYLSGLKVQQKADLRGDGYLVWPKRYDAPDRKLEAAVYDHQAMQDLLTGRIAFFEKPILDWRAGDPHRLENPASYEQFGLGKAGDLHCVSLGAGESMLHGLRLPAGKCLTRIQSRKSKARYRLRIGARNTWIELIDPVTDKRYAIFRSFSHWSGWTSDAGALIYRCPSPHESFDLVAQRALTAFVLPDREGRVVTMAQLQKWHASVPQVRRGFSELPPREVTGQPTLETDRTCHLEVLPSEYRLEKVTAYGTGKTLVARLDASQNTVGQKEVVVNLPGQSVVLWLQSYNPTVWHILRTPGSKVEAIIVSGTHGQAVLGVERSVPLFIQTAAYNPASNCVPSELGKVLNTVMSNSVATNENDGNGDDVLVIGSRELNPSLLIYSRERVLDEFTMPLRAVKPFKKDPMTPLVYSPNPLPE